jgi:hypothetical protein
MTGKKIIFAEKPITKDTEELIDNWISGKDNNLSTKKDRPILKRTTIYLPEEIRRNLKMTAIKQERTMTEIIIEAVNQYLA